MFALGLGRVKTLREMAMWTAFLGFGLYSDRGHQRLDAHDVHYPSEIVSEHVECHLGGNLGQTLHHKVRRPHPHLQRGEGMLDRLATRSAARKASMRFGRPSAETELKYPMSVPYHAHVEIRTLSMLSVSI